MFYIFFAGESNKNLFALLFYGCCNNFFQVFLGLLRLLVYEAGFAFSLFQLALNNGDLIWCHLIAVLLQIFFRAADYLV